MAEDRVTPVSPQRSVVVIHDDFIQTRVITGILSKAGFSLQSFSDPREALKSFSSGPPPDLVISDLHMPHLDGWQLCRLLRSPTYPSFNQIPLLIVSATFSGQDVAQFTLLVGASSFLAAPFTGEQLLEQVERSLRGSHKNLSGKQVLVAEESQAIASWVRHTLQESGFQVTVAPNLMTTFQLLSKNLFHLAILACRFPDGTSESLLSFCRDHFPGMACLIMNSDSHRESPVKWLRMGATEYFLTPIDPAHLVEICRRAQREKSLSDAEARLQTQQHKLDIFRHIAENTSDGLLVFEHDHITFVSPSYCDILGYPISEEIGRTIPDLCALVHPEELPVLRHQVATAVSRRAPSIICQYRAKARNDEYRWREDHARFVYAPDGQLIRTVVVCRDISDRKRADAEKEELREQLFQAQKMDSIGRLATGIAQDFNNLLSIIATRTDLAMHQAGSHPGLLEQLAGIQEATRRSANLTRQLLSFAETTFGLEFSRTAESPGVSVFPFRAPVPATDHETILIVEDDADLLECERTALELLGFSVLACSTPSAALASAASFPGPIHLLVTDLLLPEMNGNELSNQLSLLRPDIKTLFVSGFSSEDSPRNGSLPSRGHWLQKPYDSATLANAIRKILRPSPC